MTTDLLLVGYFPPQGAIAELFSTIASAAAELVPTAVLAPSHLDLAPNSPCQVISFPYSSRRPFDALTKAGRTALGEARRLRPKVMLLFTQHPLNAVALRWVAPERIALWWHEPAARGQAASRAHAAAYGLHDHLVVKRTDHIVVAASSVRSAVPPEFLARTSVVPFPVPTDFVEASDRFEATPTDAVFFGRLEPYKGLDVLANALEILWAQGVPTTVRVIGPGDLGATAPALAALAARHPGAVDRIDEYAPAHDVVSALRSSRVAVFPYRTAAGSTTFPIAAWNGSAIVASKVGAFSDLLDDTRAVLVEPDDAHQLAQSIGALLADEPRRRAIAEHAERWAHETLSPTAVARSLLAAVGLGESVRPQ